MRNYEKPRDDLHMNLHAARVRNRNQLSILKGPVVYWMSRDQRVQDNWALLYAQQLALETQSPLVVFFGLAPSFLGATARQYGFMLKGLEEAAGELNSLQIGFAIATGSPPEELLRFCKEIKAGAVVADFSPLRNGQEWRTRVAKQAEVAMFEVDAHNIVPCWKASPKQEFAAYTFRPKINKLLETFLVPFPKLKPHPYQMHLAPIDFVELKRSLRLDESVMEVDWLVPGEKAAHKAFKNFAKTRLNIYDKQRNDPTVQAQSDLSPYLHFGHISAQRIAWELSQSHAPEQTESFLEELIVRRELADNFCFYNPCYDSIDGFPDWAKLTHKQHATDPRVYHYSDQEFEEAKTHDDLWNAAQREMVLKGKMHGYMRMYWAKKILEWTPSPKEALRIAIWLNDKYELDGRDPNGYCGIAWSIGGVHDRAWFDRPIFGKIRYMSYNGCKSKFSIKAYINVNFAYKSNQSSKLL
jgi:deoxyribodipyrimidine photo-lyase